MDDKCILHPERDCLGLKRADEVAGDLKTLDRRLTDFQQAVSDTNSRFGARIGTLEAKQEVREEQFRQFKEKLDEINKDIAEFKRDNKDSLAEFRGEHKQSVDELRKSINAILEALTPLKHEVDDLNRLSDDVDELKAKPGETWEHIKKQSLGWAIALILAIVAAALGLSKYL